MFFSSTSLNKAEEALVANHPFLSVTVAMCFYKANNKTKDIYGRNRDGYINNAFKHAYWSALIAYNIGYDMAITFTDAHEDFPENNEADKTMDLANNKTGAFIGQSIKGAIDNGYKLITFNPGNGYSTTVSLENPEAAIEAVIKFYADNGFLKVNKT